MKSTLWAGITVRKCLRIFLLAATLVMVARSPAGNAVTLEQKWHPGEQLTYDLSVDGTLSLDSDPTAPFMWAGMPLEVAIRGTGDLGLDTRSVNPDGSGVVAVRLPHFKVAGAAWEQKALLDINDGVPAFSFNGKAANLHGVNAHFLVAPTYGLEIGPNGRIRHIVSLDAASTTPGADQTVKGDETVPGATAPDGFPVNVQGLLRSALLQALPALWPAGDVAVGEKWTVPSRLPVPIPRDVQSTLKGVDAAPFRLVDLGQFTMTLKGEEQVGDYRALRVALEGALAIDKEKAALINNAVGNKAGGAKLISAAQKVSGDLWFDGDAGRLVKADLIVKNQVKGSGVTHPAKGAAEGGDAGTAPETWSSIQGFTGSVKLNLRSVTLAAKPGTPGGGGPAAPIAPALLSPAAQ